MLQLGNVVKVVHLGQFNNKEGKIERTDMKHADGPIGVRFGRDCRHLFSYPDSPPEKLICFEEVDLQVMPDFSPQVRVNWLFSPNMWHHLFTLKNPINTTQLCVYKDCFNSVAKRAMVNTWGTVAEYDMCEGHYNAWNGKNVDDVPVKKRKISE